jgi:hypothetical protein
MNAIKKARKYMQENPASQSSKTLARLILALESEGNFHLADLYELDYDSFLLALSVMKDWRLDRYYTAKGQILDITLQLTQSEH